MSLICLYLPKAFDFVVEGEIILTMCRGILLKHDVAVVFHVFVKPLSVVFEFILGFWFASE